MNRSLRAHRDVAAGAVALTTPTLAVAAHALSSGMAPGSAGIVLVAGSGLAAGLIARGLRSLPAMALLLTAAALVNHLLLTVASSSQMPMSHDSDASMLILHALAIPLCALLIVAADRLYDIVTAVLVALGRRRLPRPAGVHPVRIVSALPPLAGRDLVGSNGLRGPPLPQ
ncbi:hypothetical protein [Jongsikchunia kroppenstedtii]|uniref:hypothetical protein n=1 Tax=Jongsikchunia kroppenstedtii TaxID=1121721 RepID=UPI000362D6F8|nr:hypothetical protein [Jongsikchunia kroppenstedtii]